VRRLMMIKDIREVLALLRDYSFKELITPLIIRVMYAIGTVVAVWLVFMDVVNGFRVTEGRGIVMLVASPFILVFYVMVLRVALEIVMALFYKASGTPVVVAGSPKPEETPAEPEKPAAKTE
jgi:hypothetical protein